MKKYLLLVLLYPLIAKSQNVGININSPQEKLHVNGSVLITPFNANTDTIKNSSIGLGFNSYYIYAYDAAKAALRFGSPNPDSKWFHSNVGYLSLAFGVGADAAGDASFAYGFNTRASGANSGALGGYGNISSGYGSLSGGDYSVSAGLNSLAFGESVIVKGNNSVGFGSYNDTSQSTNTLFSISNGTASNGRKNALSILNNGNTGINISNPAYALDVTDVTGQGVAGSFSSANPSFTFLQVKSTASGTNTANIGISMLRNSGGSGYMFVNGTNNIVWSTSGVEQVVLTPAGNLGIAQSAPGFPLNFANVQGDKISLYGNSGAHYGIGVQNFLLQLHTDVAAADIAFGYGSSTSFTENMRVRGNGYVGIGTSNPGARLQLQQAGLYAKSEGQGNGLEIWDTTGAGNGILYMGADNTNGYGYIQSVATGSFRDLLLQGRGGNVYIGKDASSVLSVKGDMVVDYTNNNTGSVNYAVRFGGSSGEAIGSKRNAGGNQNGLDFYTGSNRRMGISNSGTVDVVNNLTVQNGMGIVRSNSAAQIKRVNMLVNATFTLAVGDTMGFGSNRLLFSETFSAPPTVMIAGISSIISGVPNPAVQWLFYDITTSSCRGMIINPTKYPITYSAYWNVVAEGPQ